MQNLSFTEENYLKAICMLLRDHEVVTTTALAESMGTSPASVTDMAGKLKGKRLVLYEKYRGITLTPLGLRVALLVIRRHRLWECFLVDKLRFSWEEVHEIAEDLEHVRSNMLTERLSQFLGNPDRDPHGDPIPDAVGKISRTVPHNLLTIPVSKKLRVTGVKDQSSSLLKFLHEKGISLGTRLDILQRYDFDHSVEIKIHNQATLTVSEQVARNIYVTSHAEN